MANINDYGFPFTSVAGDRQYGSDDWRTYFDALGDSGVVDDVLNELAVAESTVPARSVQIATGAVCIKGALIYADSISTLTFTTNTSGSTRIDRVVARLNYDDRKIEFAVLQGTPSGSPVAPSLTQNTTYWELSLAKVTLANGYTTITNANITDERSDDTVCGYTTFRALNKVDKIVTGTNAKTYSYTHTQTSGSTATQGSVLIETTPSESSANLITSGAVYPKLDKITSGTNAKTYAYTRTQISGTTATQDSIQVDTAVTENSGNLVTSGGVYTALSSLGSTIYLKETFDSILSEQLVRLIDDKVYSRYGVGSETQFATSALLYSRLCQISTDKFILVYTENATFNLGRAVVVSVSGTTATLGTPVSFSSTSADYLSIAKLDTDKAIVCYRENNTGVANVLSVSGTTISVGSQKTYETGDCFYHSVCQIGTNKVLVAYRDSGNSGYGTACAMSVSGTTITAGTPVVFASTSCSDIAVANLNTNKAIVVYTGTNSYANACAMTVSTLTITAGTPLVFKSTLTTYKSIVQVTTDKVLVCYSLGITGTAIVLTVSSTTVSAGSEVAFTTNWVTYTAVAPYDATNSKYMVLYTDVTNNYYGTSCVLTLTGSTTFYADTPIVFNASNTSKNTIEQIDTRKMLFAYGESSPAWGSISLYSQLAATGYAFSAQFNSNSISGRSDNINVVPYIALS